MVLQLAKIYYQHLNITPAYELMRKATNWVGLTYHSQMLHLYNP